MIAPGLALTWLPLVFTLGLSPISATAGLPNGVCTLENQMCEMHENVITIVTGVSSIAECKVICDEEATCQYLTYYKEESPSLSEACVLYTSCDVLRDCKGCITASVACQQLTGLCSQPLESHIGNNLLEFVSDLPEEEDCHAACFTEKLCSFYRFHASTDPVFPGACFLLTHLLAPVLPCQHCRTGLSDCSDTNGCFFLLDDTTVANTTTSLLVTDTFSPTAVQPVALGTCSLNIVAIGGGGGSSNSGAGGGSGHVLATTHNISGHDQLTVTVGAGGQKSSVTSERAGRIAVAEPGQAAPVNPSKDGGAGFCGGGGYGYTKDTIHGYHGGDGGSGGDSGEAGVGTDAGAGGHGTRLDLMDVMIEGFTLTPGQGGVHRSTTGGGGGGVLINNTGPVGGVERDGQGFGAGKGFVSVNQSGRPGAVILTFK